MIESLFLTKAKRNIQAAQLLFDNQMYDEAVNRAYYAAFQAALAKLSEANIQVDRKSHKSVQANFNNAFIHKQKVFSNHLKSYLSDLHAVRIDADYKPLIISKKVAMQQIKKAKEFVELIDREMRK